MKAINSLAALLLASTLLSAQQPHMASTAQIAQRTRAHRAAKSAPQARPKPTPKTSSDFFVSEARVHVTKDETVVRLAMAQHGSVLIELPANDGPRYIIPGDPEMATVDQKALERNKRAIVVRPGTQFVPPPRNVRVRNPAATVTVQMRSGLVVTFLFYPVEDLAQNVHRCVLHYNRDEVVARRRAAGLPVNLDGTGERGETTAQSTAAPTSIVVEDNQGKDLEDRTPSETKIKPIDQTRFTPRPGGDEANASSTSEKNGDIAKQSPELVASLRTALDEAIKEPKRFKNWTRSTHGLRLSIHNDDNSGKPFNVVIVAVRNTRGKFLRLVADSPELLIETVDKKGATLNVRPVSKTQTETSTTSGVIPAYATVYFAIAFASPVLDAHQQLKLVVAQTTAADEPASIKLAPNGR